MTWVPMRRLVPAFRHRRYQHRAVLVDGYDRGRWFVFKRAGAWRVMHTADRTLVYETATRAQAERYTRVLDAAIRRIIRGDLA